MPASAYFLHSHEHEEEPYERAVPPAPVAVSLVYACGSHEAPEVHAPRIPAARKPAPAAKPPAARPHFSRPAAHSRDRKPATGSTGSRTARRPGPEARSSSSRPAAGRSSNGTRPAPVRAGPRMEPSPPTASMLFPVRQTEAAAMEMAVAGTMRISPRPEFGTGNLPLPH